ncbi:uncharacterized protein METZ01_LOCUS465720 [marine metagenome]|uniref:Uncharacterized protein n=1 Tax=marine metagenome TaxID=408172 RepID=A0A383AY40_9ZZZZ
MTHIRLAAADVAQLGGALRATWKLRFEKNVGGKRKKKR